MSQFYLKYLCLFFMLFTNCMLYAKPISIEILKNYYINIKSISASVKQTKSAPYLFKPIISNIELKYINNKITWKTITPTEQTIVIQNNELYTISNEGVKEVIPITKSPEGAKLVSFFNSLFSMDFESLQKTFELSFYNQTMEAKPKKNSGLNFINKMVFSFDKNLNIHSVLVEAGQEKTEMQFSQVKINIK